MQTLKELIINNKLSILMLIIGLSIGAMVMSFFIPERIAKLDNGEEVLLTINDKPITANDYYEYLKDLTSIEHLIQQIDQTILDQKYETTKEMKKEVQTKMQNTIKQYTEYYQYSEDEFLAENGFQSEEDFYKLMMLEHKRALYEHEYLSSMVKSEEINNYYIKNVIPDMEIKTIQGDEKTLNKILDELKNNDYNTVIKKYQKKVTYQDYSYVSFFDQEFNQDIYSEALDLAENSYTPRLVSINNQYYIIFKGKVKEKADINTIKDLIKDKIVAKKINEDTNNKLYQQALIHLRKENHLTFKDTGLMDEYQAYVNNYQ